MIGNMVTKGGTGGETKGLLLGWIRLSPSFYAYRRHDAWASSSARSPPGAPVFTS